MRNAIPCVRPIARFKWACPPVRPNVRIKLKPQTEVEVGRGDSLSCVRIEIARVEPRMGKVEGEMHHVLGVAVRDLEHAAASGEHIAKNGEDRIAMRPRPETACARAPVTVRRAFPIVTRVASERRFNTWRCGPFRESKLRTRP